MFLLFVSAYTQTFLTTDYNPDVIPLISSVKINPESKFEQFRSVVIEKALYSKKISPRNGLLYTDVSYIIKNAEGLIVYQSEYNAALENQFELFITEDNIYQVSIPRFEWDATFFDAEEILKKSQEYNGAKDGNYVPDGVYYLEIKLLNKTDNRETFAANIQTYTIIVDRKPPVFESIIATVCENPVTEDYSWLVYSTTPEYVSIDDEENAKASNWSVETFDGEVLYSYPQNIENAKCIAEGIYLGSPIPLPPIFFSANKNTQIKITAYDEIGNKQIINQSVQADFLEQEYLETRNRLAFLDLIKKYVQKEFSKNILDVNADVNKSITPNQIDSNILKLYENHFSSEILFSSQDGDVRIPVVVKNGQINFTLPAEKLVSGMQPVYVVSTGTNSGVFVGTVKFRTLFPDVLFEKKDSKIENSLFCCSFTPKSMEYSNLSWVISIKDRNGNIVKTLEQGSGFNAGENGDFVWFGDFDEPNITYSSAEKFTVELRFENNVAYSLDVVSGLVTKTGLDGRTYLDLPDIIFPGNRESFLEDTELYSANGTTLTELTRIIKEYQDKIEFIDIFGYANPESDLSEKNRHILEKENETSLIPLSQRRADYVKELLVLKGIPREIIRAIGCGGIPWEANPHDKSVNWKNRRVRFSIILKEDNINEK